MLIAFSVENFKSIRDLQTLSLEASADKHLESSNVIETGKHRLLKTAAIYGPNASGKTNVLAAMLWLRNFILGSSKHFQQGDTIPVNPFRLSSATENAPTYFEVEFLSGGVKYRYGFEITQEQVMAEWLYRKSPKTKEVALFTRAAQEIQISMKFPEGKDLQGKTRKNALFLSVCAQFNGQISGEIIAWIRKFQLISGLNDKSTFGFTAQCMQEGPMRKHILEMAKKADFNIQSLDCELKEVKEEDLPTNIPVEEREDFLRFLNSQNTAIRTRHDKRNGGGEVIGQVEFDLAKDESEGTRKFIALSGPIADTLESGQILVIDEFEARLHPKLTQALVDLFHSPVNDKNAQLIFATHDVTLMDPERFRRDQLWFCEKDETGATDLYRLSEFDSSKVRANTPFSRQYMLGLFGAVPNLAYFQEAVAEATHE